MSAYILRIGHTDVKSISNVTDYNRALKFQDTFPWISLPTSVILVNE